MMKPASTTLNMSAKLNMMTQGRAQGSTCVA
jgi:hypothetical protein